MHGTVLIPHIVLKEGEDRLLDEVSIDDIAQATGYQVQVVETNAQSLVQTMGLLAAVKHRKIKAPIRRKYE